MAKKEKKVECPKCLPGWLAAFGDMMSLLLCFFVLLLSMSSVDAKKLEEAIGSLAGALGILDGGVRPDISRNKNLNLSPSTQVTLKSQDKNTIKEAIGNMNQILKASNSQEISLDEAEQGFIIRLPASILFEKDSATINNQDGLLFIKRIAMIMSKMPSEILADVIGHTDDSVTQTEAHSSNWKLSSSRAISVAEELIRNGADPKRLVASGRAEFSPIASNTTEAGRAKNRRVEIYFHSLDIKKAKETKKSILDEDAKE